MTLKLLKKAILNLVTYMQEVQKIPPQEIEISLRLEIEDLINEILRETGLDQVSNLRLDDEDFFYEDEKFTEIPDFLFEDQKSFDEIWKLLLEILKNK